MNPRRKIISWEPDHRKEQLNKNTLRKFRRHSRVVSQPRHNDFDCLRLPRDAHLPNKDGGCKLFSGAPSQHIESQKHIDFNSFRNVNPKHSSRSLFGGGESTMEMGANISNYDVLGPKNEQMLETNIQQHDNKPLHNSDSDLEKDIFKTKTLRENDSLVGGFGRISSRPPNEESSFNQNFVIDSGLSELAPIKPPNAYRKITSINYSAYNDNKSNVEQTPGSYRKRDLVFEEDLSFNRSNLQLDPRRRMTPKEIFDMKMKQNSRGSKRQIGMNNCTSISPRPFNHMYARHRPSVNNADFSAPLSERMIFQKRMSVESRFQNVPPNIMSNHHGNKGKKANVFHSSEKSIPMNKDLLKKRFEMNSKIVQYKNIPPKHMHAHRRNFSPFESEEQQQFKKVKASPVPRMSIPKSRPSVPKKEPTKVFENPIKYEHEKERKKNENERIENNMMESIEMIELGQFKRYRNLLAFLISLFVTGNIKEDAMDLFTEELQILKIIIYRKFKKHIDIK